MNLEFDCTNVKNGKSAYNGYLCSLYIYSKTSVKWPLSKRPNIGFHDQLSLNAGQKYCRMLQGGGGGHSAIRSTFIKLPFVIKICVLSIFGLPFYTGFTVWYFYCRKNENNCGKGDFQCYLPTS